MHKEMPASTATANSLAHKSAQVLLSRPTTAGYRVFHFRAAASIRPIDVGKEMASGPFASLRISQTSRPTVTSL